MLKDGIGPVIYDLSRPPDLVYFASLIFRFSVPPLLKTNRSNESKACLVDGSLFYDFALLALVTLNSAAADLYTRIPTGRHVSEANDINDQGEIVGGPYYFNGSDNILTLGLASTNGSYVGLFGLNNLGLAVGASTVGTNHPGPARAFSFNSKTGAIRDLGSLFGPTAESRAYAVNDAGVIVGSSTTTNSTRAVRFEPDGRIIDLGTLGGSWSEAADINENGDVVGTSRNSQDVMRAFWIPANGSMIDLGTLGGSNSWAARINNKGEIVGSSETADGSTRAFLCKNGKMIDLGTLGGVSAAFGINDEGTVVGWSWGTTGEPWTAFIKYPELPMRDLAAITTVDPGDDLFRARAINNRGEIAASIFRPVYALDLHTPASYGRGLCPDNCSMDNWNCASPRHRENEFAWKSRTISTNGNLYSP